MASVMQGDAYNIPVTIKSGNGTLITPEIAACVEITVGQFTKRWPGQVTFDEKTGQWQFPVTQKQTFRFLPGTAVVQARVVFQDGSIMGGSGAPVRVEQSASHGTLPQPEKTEAATGSAPKATEVTIPTVHDIDVSLHSQVILSDPIKAPYIGENGNWYEYDAETGTFVDTGTSASGIPPIAPDTAGKYLTNDGSKAEWGVMSGGTDLSLGITGATVGQIVKIIEVDSSGKPTKWQAVNDRLPEVSPRDNGKALYVEQIGEFEYGYGFTKIPNINTFIPLGITDASPGQFARIKFVDDLGQPTAWEAVDMPSGGGGETWELIAEIDFDVDAANDVSVWEYKNLPNYKELSYKKVGLVGSTETASGLSISINDGLTNFSSIQYAKKDGQSNGWGKILLLPFGWIHVNSGSANSPTNYSYAGVQAMYNAIPVDGDSITSVRLTSHTVYKIAGGKLSLYGRK